MTRCVCTLSYVWRDDWRWLCSFEAWCCSKQQIKVNLKSRRGTRSKILIFCFVMPCLSGWCHVPKFILFNFPMRFITRKNCDGAYVSTIQRVRVAANIEIKEVWSRKFIGYDIYIVFRITYFICCIHNLLTVRLFILCTLWDEWLWMIFIGFFCILSHSLMRIPSEHFFLLFLLWIKKLEHLI